MQAIARFKDAKTTGSVRDSIRTATQLGIIDDPESWFGFHDARNQATHTYGLEMADEIYHEVYQKIKELPPFVQRLLESVEKTLAAD
jgi:nucleotidyltransferase substrate binding protein (TIGR01987 family)